MGRNVARLVVDFEWLREALGLPEDAVIYGAYGGNRLGAMEIKVQHPDLPVVEEGAVIPIVWPLFDPEDGELASWVSDKV
jgi:hypothetical protein